MSNGFIRSYGRKKGKGKLKELELLDIFSIQHEKISEYIANDRKFVLEIGFGDGEHIFHKAKLSQNDIFIGCEPYLNGVNNLIRMSRSENIENLFIWNDDVRILLSEFNYVKYSIIYILFPDPWPKERHKKRRLISKDFVNMLKDCIALEGKIIIATDEKDYSKHIESIFQELSMEYSVIVNDLPENWVQTKYYRRAKDMGNDIFLIEYNHSNSLLSE